MDHSEGNSCPAVSSHTACLTSIISLSSSSSYPSPVQCRIHVKCVRKNHIVNNLIEAYLRANPEKKRPEDDLKELNAKNKITKDMVGTFTCANHQLCTPRRSKYS